MRIFFSVGEPSGDLHASNLIRHLKSKDPTIDFVGLGGPKMQAAGCQLHYDLTQLAVMFLWGALKNLRKFFRLIADADRYFRTNAVDAVVLIDYPGFNWWIARKAKRNQIPVFYYGVPQMWAWGPWRVRKIRKFVDFVLCKLPFEVSWFAERGCWATYVGHPYFDQLHSQTYDQQFLDGYASQQPLVLLLPGSRDSEVKLNLPILLSAAEKIAASRNDVRFAVGCYNQRHATQAVSASKNHPLALDIFYGRTPELMKLANVCIACSGSVSLELLHHRKPTVIVYRIGYVILLMQSLFLRCKFITLANLIGTTDIRKKTWMPYNPDRPGAEPAVMPEYLSVTDCSGRVAKHVVTWLADDGRMTATIDQMDRLAREFATPGATERAAEFILRGVTAKDCSARAAA